MRKIFIACILILCLFQGKAWAGGYCSSSYYAPISSYCSPSPCYESFHYDQPGWFRGRWYPAGWYQWRGGHWYLRGYGACYGYACPEDYYGRGRCEPTYVTQFQSLIGIPIPTYYSTYVPPPALPTAGTYGTQQPTAVQTSTTTAQQQPAAVPRQAPDTTRILAAITTLNTNVISLDKRTREFDNRLRKLEGQPQVEPGPPPAPRESVPTPRESVPTPRESAPESVPPMPPAALTAASILANHCAACHTTGRLFQGKDIHGDDRHATLAILAVDGQIAEVSGPSLNKILEHVEAGTMPPVDIVHQAGKITAEEAVILVAWIKKQVGIPASKHSQIERKTHAKAFVPLRSALVDLDGR